MTSTTDSVGTRTITQRLADYVVDLRYEDLPPSVVSKAKDHLVHALGVALRGYSTESGQRAVQVALRLSGADGNCSIIGDRRRVRPLDAVFANSCLMEHDGLDDAVLPPGVHPGIITQPVAWALGEATHTSGQEFLVAVVAGYDVMTKLCNPIWTWTIDPPRRPNSVVAPFGAAATAARLLCLSRPQTAHALGHAGQAGMGIAEGSEHMWTISPQLARNGAMAAALAEAGLEASPTMVEGRYGVYRSCFFQDVPEALEETLATLGHEFEISRAIIKRHVGSAFNIIPTTLAQGLVDQHRLAADDISSVDVTLPSEREPREAAWEEAVGRPTANRTSRLGSLRFRIAMILTDGRTDPVRYERPATGALLDVLGKVRLRFEDGLPLQYARVDVTTTSGQRLAADGETLVVPPWDWAEWLGEGGRALLPDGQLTRLVELIGDLENVDDVADLMACVIP